MTPGPVNRSSNEKQMPSSYDNSPVVPTPAESFVDSGPDGQPAKRRRINFACNYCRNRKTRCDEQKPACRACILAGIECVTTDRRRPGVEVQRRETKRRMSRASSSSLPQSSSASAGGPPYASPPSAREAEVCVGSAGAAAADAPGHKSSPSAASLGRDDNNNNNHSGRSTVPTPGHRGSTSAPNVPPPQEEEEPAAGNGKFQGKLPVVKPSRHSTSVEILADWVDLASRRLGLQHRRGLPPCNPSSHRIRALLSSEPCRFPPAGSARVLAARFFDGANVLYPLLHRDRFQKDIDLALASNPVEFAERRGIALLAQMYLVWSIGFSAEPLLDPVVDPQEYLDYCKTLLGHLVITNSVDHVRAIVLLALCMHCYDDTAGSWNTLTVGVNMATGLGLHKPRTCRRKGQDRRPDALDDEERRLFWLGIYAFEKFLAFEMGRLSSIDDEDCYAPHVQDLDTYTEAGTSSRGKAFAVTVDLARILSEIGRKSVIVSRKEDGVVGPALQAVIAEKVQTTGEAQLLLTRWGESVPDELRLVILSRNSLLISEEAISSGANIIAKGKPWDYIVRNGQSIAANAARKMLRLLVETLDSKSNSVYPSLLIALHALATLSVHIVTHPDSRISAMDFHLVQTASEAMKEVYSRLRGDGLFNSLLHKIDGILQQSSPAPGRLATQSFSETIPSATASQRNSWSSRSNEVNHNTPDSWAGQSEGQIKDAGPTPDMATAPLFNQNYIVSGGDFGYDPMGGLPMPGDEWSPSISDGVGWDWSCFSQLLAEQFQSQ